MTIKYIGSKRLLLNNIYEAVKGEEIKTVIDMFSGTARCGRYFKAQGLRVISNDNTAYAKILADTYVKADYEKYYADAKLLVDEYNSNQNKIAGYFTDTFCIQSRFFHPSNGERIDYIREDIDTKNLDPMLKSIILTSLMVAADSVDSTCGIQMAYLKQFAPRALKPLILKIPNMLPASPYGECEVYQCDANELAPTLVADAAYLDPPYSTHQYIGNYHIHESLVLNDKPEFYGVACKRVDVKERKSQYCSKKTALSSMENLVQSLNVKKIVVSFSDEGLISKEEMETILSKRGSVQTIGHDFKRYIGSQIGIHNLKGEVVGEVSHLRNTEYIYIVDVNQWV